MCKALATETANKVAYDGLQIHGGAGYMRDFNAERFYRDARITNIYEGTTQLQIIAAIGGVMQRHNDTRINELLALPLEGRLAELRDMVRDLHKQQQETVAFMAELKDPAYHDLMARSLVEMETMVLVSLLLLRDAALDDSRAAIAERYVLDSLPEFAARRQRILSGDRSLIERKQDILDY